MTWGVVIPSNRPEKLKTMLHAWGPLFEKHNVLPLVVFDGPEAELLGLPNPRAHVWCWPNIPDWIPRRTDMIRSWGIYKAWQAGHDYTLSLDDDTRPTGDPFAAYEQVFEQGASYAPYLDVGALTDTGLHMRGFPYKGRRVQVAVQYGGWHGVPDLDGATQVNEPVTDSTFSPVAITVPAGAAVTGCAMNMAWQTRYAPIMWQLPLLEGRYNRWGDIWAGLFAKATLDSLGECVAVNGKASVRHDRASDPAVNAEKEAPGMRLNEVLWEEITKGNPGRGNGGLIGAYRRITDQAADVFALQSGDYAAHFIDCRDQWLALFR